MEVQQKNILQAHLANSVFAKKLFDIPMFKAAVCTAGDAYVKVKDSNAIVRRSIELTLNVSSMVVDKLTPFANRGMSVASPLTARVDAIAAASLDKIIATVPVINEEPNEIAENTRSAIIKQVTWIQGYSEGVLKTWPMQSAMDLYESILSTATTTLDNVLPAGKDEKTEQNGLAPTKESLGEEGKHLRAGELVRRTYSVFHTAFNRVFGICKGQAEAVDKVYNQVKSAVTDSAPVPQNSDQNNLTNNGDANKNQSKKAKKQKNAQE